jgi:hypothetical protein
MKCVGVGCFQVFCCFILITLKGRNMYKGAKRVLDISNNHSKSKIYLYFFI